MLGATLRVLRGTRAMESLPLLCHCEVHDFQEKCLLPFHKVVASKTRFRRIYSVGWLKEVRCDSNIGLDQNSFEFLVVAQLHPEHLESQSNMRGAWQGLMTPSCRCVEAENGGCPVKDDELVAVTVKPRKDWSRWKLGFCEMMYKKLWVVCLPNDLWS